VISTERENPASQFRNVTGRFIIAAVTRIESVRSPKTTANPSRRRSTFMADIPLSPWLRTIMKAKRTALRRIITTQENSIPAAPRL
jgi:hypothetical protein